MIALTWWLAGQGASAQEPVTITGVLRNGTPDVPFAPEAVPVTLRTLEGVVILDSRTASPEADGGFTFADVSVAEGRVYFLSAEYRGAEYSVTLAADELGEPVTLTVYEATSSTEGLAITAYTVFVTGAVPFTVATVVPLIAVEVTVPSTVT